MMKSRRSFRLKGIIGWFFLVFIFSLFVFPSYSDYTTRAQLYEALSITSAEKGMIAEYYEKNQHCPTTQNLINNHLEGKYLKSIRLMTFEGTNHCYIVATMRQNSQTDKRVRGKSIMLVMQPLSPWISNVSCETNLPINLANCQITSVKE